ncbi:hypothetical protein R0K17_25725, partial [Planococcus sp. SIMBA_143]
MRGFYLTRTEMGTILKTIRRQEIPDKILLKAMKRSGSEKEDLPTIFAKLLKATEGSFGFSINEIATLGN